MSTWCRVTWPKKSGSTFSEYRLGYGNEHRLVYGPAKKSARLARVKHESIDLDQPDESGLRAPSFKLIALLLVVVGLAIFFFQNGQDANVEFLWTDGQWPVWTVIGVSVLAGAALDRLLSWQLRRAKRRKSTTV
jgi:uncharacterized integral membrane protein